VDLLGKLPPLYQTSLGAAYVGDSLGMLRRLPSASINLVITSPPYALHFKKAYGNVTPADYIEWFLPFAAEIKRVLKEDGSFVLNIGGTWNAGSPTRSIYQYKLLIALVELVGLVLAQELYWNNPAKMPVPAEWVTVRRIRVKDSVEHLWWFGKTPWPKANNRNVLKPYSKDMIRLNQRGVKARTRPSGHVINASFDQIGAGGSIPGNVIAEDIATDLLTFGNNSANDSYTQKCKAAGATIHPARFPAVLPEFFVKLTTAEGDVVVDPFAGSNTTGAVCEGLGRRWLAFESSTDYLASSKFRFDDFS